MAEKKQDRLDRESSKAIAAGMSYGKWKARQRETGFPLYVEDEEQIESRGTKKWCTYCGSVFFTESKIKKYCCDICREKAQLRKWRYKRELSRM